MRPGFASRSAAATALGLCFLSCSAFGYTLEPAKWFQPGVTLHLRFPAAPFVLTDGSLSYYQSFENALQLWNEQLANFQFDWVEEQAGSTFAEGNGQSEVSMQSSMYGESFGSTTLAATLYKYSAGQMREADIVFNIADYKFDSARGTQGKGADLHRIALHELGHVLGLDHSLDDSAIMFKSISETDRLQPDDLVGGWALYGHALTAPPDTAGSARLANISTRAQIATETQVMIGGFIISESAKTVLIRAIGPSLSSAGISVALGDPVLEIHHTDAHGSDIVDATNDDWKDDGAQAQLIAETGVAPLYDRESAIYATLPPGAYTAIMSGKNNVVGVGLVEVYDLAPSCGRIANISTRGQLAGGESVMIGGFIVGGPQSQALIIRGIGPSLRNAGVADAIADPLLELRNGNGDLLQANDDWGSQSLKITGAIRNSGVAPSDPLESAIFAYLAPGNYTAVLRGKDNAPDVGLVEVYRADLLN